MLITAAALLVTEGGCAQTLAVLEHPQCAKDQARVVRPLFVKEPSGWRPVRLTDAAVGARTEWFTIGRDGPSQAVVADAPAKRPTDSWLYARDYFLRPANASSLPTALNAAGAFGGWCAPPANRPIALSSERPGTQMDQAREPATVSAPELPLLLRAMRKTYSSARLCYFPSPKAAKSIPVTLGVQDLVIEKVIEVEPGRRLVGVNLRRPVFECGDELGDAALPRWFALDDKARYVGASMQFIDELRDTGSNQSLYLFWYSGYDEDGYVLLSSALDNGIKFTWNYH